MSPAEASFRFRGQAYGVSGRITSPVPEVLPVQAEAVLPESGGYGTSHVNDFRGNKYIHFDRAHAVVSGAKLNDSEGDFHGSYIQSTIEGLNIMEMITADRIVARLSYRHTGKHDAEPVMHLIGSRFENLRIAGIPVKVRLALDVVDAHGTYADMTAQYADKKSSLRAHIDKRPKDVHEKIVPHLADAPATALPSRISLVRDLEVESPGFHHANNVIYVPGFATIRLAEVDLSHGSRSITMLRITFNSPPQGGADIGSAGSQ